jgi:CTP synthase (UTP-ammonia lyase)
MVKIAIVGDYRREYFNHVNTDSSLHHVSCKVSFPLKWDWVATTGLYPGSLASYDGIWVAPGSPYLNMTNVLETIRFAREKNVPLLGTCGGFQHVVIEYARNVLGYKDAGHAEYEPSGDNLFITPLGCSVKGVVMQVFIKEASQAYRAYRLTCVNEEYHCRFGVNPECRSLLESNGMVAAGTDRDGEIRIVELPENDFFVATLFLPQSLSVPGKPHPLIARFIEAAYAFHSPEAQGS